MKKELIAVGKPYISVLYFSILLFTSLIFIESFRSVPVGLTFLIILLIKFYSSSNLLTYLISYLISYSLFKQKPLLNKQRVKINAAIIAGFLLLDGFAFYYLPDLVKMTYTSISFLLFLLIAGQCLAGGLKKIVAYQNV